MTKDLRYKGIKVLIETNNIRFISDIFWEHKFPVTTLALYLGTNFKRLSKYLNQPALFTFGEARKIASYFEVDDQLIFNLIYNQIVQPKAVKKKITSRK